MRDSVHFFCSGTSRLRQQTRRYAKRQLSWFRRMTDAHRLYVDDFDTPQELVEAAVDIYQQFLERSAASGNEETT